MSGLYDLHTHTILSDGEMLPIELIRRMAVAGYTTVAITDHVDISNTEPVLETLALVRESAGLFGVRLLCGVEITHVPPVQIAALARKAKATGADIVVVHGETPVEPVAPGTNLAACTCRDVNVLAHPGMITKEEAQAAASNGIALELTSRGGHNRTNGHVAWIARETGCQLVVDSDAHSPNDILDKRAKNVVARGAGLSEAECRQALSLNIDQFFEF
ncbi:histidinol phosphate phosphatase domain-containing protein [Methanoregula sp.]|jgi:histidinol phosphatase-like PHP family hydrolase|uniref:histidinol phosphate phosphatase domain-containing protein n=1 Tax=Methanoregula sp. TaxID=2052170 RepID=UPI003C20B973